MRNTIILIMLFWGSILQSVAQTPWTVTDEEKAINNPLSIDAALLEKGSDLFVKNCQSCHGPVGENKPVALSPLPPDLGNPQYLKTHSAGEIFTKFTAGRGAMPVFRTTLPEDDRWAIVAYLQDLAGLAQSANTQANEQATEAFEGKGLKMTVSFDDKSGNIIANLQGKDENGEIMPAEGVKLQFFVKRYFGNLPIGEATTNQTGYASVKAPQDIPSSFDEAMVEFMVKVKDAKNFGEINAGIKANWGLPNDHKNLLAERSLWTVRSMAPLWLIFTFHSVVAGVWIFIIYVVFLMIKLRKIGNQ